jgi:hypothetical protein
MLDRAMLKYFAVFRVAAPFITALSAEVVEYCRKWYDVVWVSTTEGTPHV